MRDASATISWGKELYHTATIWRLGSDNNNDMGFASLPTSERTNAARRRVSRAGRRGGGMGPAGDEVGGR